MQSCLYFLLPRLVWLYIRWVGWTSKIVWRDTDFYQQTCLQNPNFIYAFWHGRQVFFTWTHRGQNVATLVSQSKDGEYIARVIDLAKMQSVRGSTSKGALQSLIALARKLRLGTSVALTPDGPRGPQRSVKEGILFLAQKTGKPILPISWSCRGKWIFKGWDDFWVPHPFNHFTVSYGKPIYVLPQDDLSVKADELKTCLDALTSKLDALYQ